MTEPAQSTPPPTNGAATLGIPTHPNAASASTTSLRPENDTTIGNILAYTSLSAPQTAQEREDNPTSKLEIFGTLVWAVFDIVVLFRMGSIYLHRFEDFEGCDHPDHSDDREKEVTLWRKEQQKEWDRLSTTMALLATMNAGILKVPKEYTGVAPSLWFGAAGLSVCGVFLTTYYSIRAFPMTNSQIRRLVTATKPENRHAYFISRTLVAMAISAPTLMALWSSLLFITGIILFVSETVFDRSRFKAFALLPLSAGVLSILVSLIFGEIMGIVMYREKRLNPIGTRWCTIHIRPDLPEDKKVGAEKRNEVFLARTFAEKQTTIVPNEDEAAHLHKPSA